MEFYCIIIIPINARKQIMGSWGSFHPYKWSYGPLLITCRGPSCKSYVSILAKFPICYIYIHTILARTSLTNLITFLGAEVA